MGINTFCCGTADVRFLPWIKCPRSRNLGRYGFYPPIVRKTKTSLWFPPSLLLLRRMSPHWTKLINGSSVFLTIKQGVTRATFLWGCQLLKSVMFSAFIRPAVSLNSKRYIFGNSLNALGMYFCMFICPLSEGITSVGVDGWDRRVHAIFGSSITYMYSKWFFNKLQGDW